MSTVYEVVAVSGGREFEDFDRILTDLAALKLRGLARVAHGAHGIKRPRPWVISADALAQRAAEHLGLETLPFEVTPEEWRRIGKSAGHQRNIQMLETARPQLLLAYPHPKSKGTWQCVAHARKLQIPVVLWTPWIPEEELDLVLRQALGAYGLRGFSWKKNTGSSGHIRVL